MASAGEVKEHAARLLLTGKPLHALRLYDSVVKATPRDFRARFDIADCLMALDQRELAGEIYRSAGWYCLKAGHPLSAVVAARVLDELLGSEADDLLAGIVAHYGCESPFLGRLASRINLPGPEEPVAPPDLHQPTPADVVATIAQRAIHCLDQFDDYPQALHPIPLLSKLSEAAFRRVVATVVVGRLPGGAPIVRQGEPGQSFFFVAAGEVRVFVTEMSAGTSERDLAHLHEGAIFGEMALLSAQPRTASVTSVGPTDLLEVTRASLQAIANEVEAVGLALHQFTQDRLLKNLMATNRLFRPFSRSQQHDLLRRFTSHDVAAGTDIIREGDEGAGLFVVLTGDVDVHTRSEDGTRMPLATLRAGAVIGEMSAVRDQPTTATVTAATHTTVLFLAREYVQRIMSGVPEIRAYLEALSDDRALDTQLARGATDGDDIGPEDEIIFI